MARYCVDRDPSTPFMHTAQVRAAAVGRLRSAERSRRHSHCSLVLAALQKGANVITFPRIMTRHLARTPCRVGLVHVARLPPFEDRGDTADASTEFFQCSIGRASDRDHATLLTPFRSSRHSAVEARAAYARARTAWTSVFLTQNFAWRWQAGHALPQQHDPARPTLARRSDRYIVFRNARPQRIMPWRRRPAAWRRLMVGPRRPARQHHGVPEQGRG